MEWVLGIALVIVWALGFLGAWTIGAGFGGQSFHTSRSEHFFNVVLPALFWPVMIIWIILAFLWAVVRGRA
mgnify:CR=1 FL=1